jgi:hypothetical protein
MTDARRLNWRFVVPDARPGLLLPVGDEQVEGWARARRGPDGRPDLPPRDSVGAVAVGDLAAWTRRPGRAGTADLLHELCAAVEPGGWVCLGFGNARFPLARRGRSASLPAVRRALAHAGMAPPAVYACLPHHRSPAMIVPLERRQELDHVLDRLFLTYAPAGSSFPRLRRRLLAGLRAATRAAPHRLRAAAVPGYLLVARRPA